MGADLQRSQGDADVGSGNDNSKELDTEDKGFEEEKAELDELTIASEPSDADVYLNGEYVGQTPLTVTDLRYGR